MTEQELFTILRPFVALVSGCEQVILAAQNKNAPKGSYGSIQIRYDDSERGQANISTKYLAASRQVETTIKPQLVVTVVVEFFRDGAKLYAERLKQMNRRGDVVWPLFKEGIGIRNVGRSMDLTALQSSNYEERARCEIVLWMEGETKYIVNTIEKVPASVENERGEVIQSLFVDGTKDFPYKA